MLRSGALRAAGVILAALLSSRLCAQGSVVLTLTGGPVAIPAPAVTDYNAGMVLDGSAVSYNVNISGGPPNTLHTTTVSIRSSSGTFGPTALSNLQWSVNGSGVWQSMTTSDATVESRQISRNTGNNWTNSLLFRCLVSWTGTPPSPPAAAYTATLVVALTVTTP